MILILSLLLPLFMICFAMIVMNTSKQYVCKEFAPEKDDFFFIHL